MSWTTTLPFVLDNVDGDLKIVYTPLSQKLYQNGREIKKTGFGLGGQKYKIETTDGGDNIVTVKAKMKKGREITYRGETINLEESLSGPATVLAFIPFVAVAIAAFFLTRLQLGAIGGAFVGGCGALGMLVAANMIRYEKNIVKQLIYSVVASVASVIVFFVLLVIYGIFFGVAFSFFQ